METGEKMSVATTWTIASSNNNKSSVGNTSEGRSKKQNSHRTLGNNKNKINEDDEDENEDMYSENDMNHNKVTEMGFTDVGKTPTGTPAASPVSSPRDAAAAVVRGGVSKGGSFKKNKQRIGNDDSDSEMC